MEHRDGGGVEPLFLSPRFRLSADAKNTNAPYLNGCSPHAGQISGKSADTLSG
jgi:hypothetical protein